MDSWIDLIIQDLVPILFFAEGNINLLRLESVSESRFSGQYLFLVDFAGSAQDANVAAALVEVRKKSELYKFLGCYGQDSGK